VIRIYIASPYTNGDKEENVNLQIDVAEKLLLRGYAPYVPLLSHYQHLRHPHEEHDWYILDNEFLALCNILIRIRPIRNGVEILSSGADKEEELAKLLNLPVYTFNTIEEMCVFLDTYSLGKI